jgi:hypothetical protein
MAIVKANYIRGKPRIKAHLRYIVHRRTEMGETITRPLFGRNGALTKLQAYELIDVAKRGAFFHKFIFNFHPVKEDTRKDLNLWEITRKTLAHIKTQFGDNVPFVATIHNDHTPLRHVHGFFIVEGRLSREEFAKIKGLWKIATVETRRQRRRLDRMRENARYKKLLPMIEKYHQRRQQGRGKRGRDIRMQPACQHCGYGGMYGMPAYFLVCPNGKQWLTQRQHQYLSMGRRLHR